MPRTCTICTDERVTEIDKQLVSGGSLRNISQHFRVGVTSLHRHRHGHLPVALADAQRAEQVLRADHLLVRLEDLTGEARRLKEKAERKGDLRTSLAAVRELVRIVELMAKVSGELAPVTQQINIAMIAEWPRVLDALNAYPEARRAVVRALS